MRIEDYALIGDTQAAGLVGRDGSVDWLCLPRFDSGACFAALLGDQSNGRWRICPAGDVRQVERRYVPGTLVLETTFTTAEGTVRVVDCMPVRGKAPDVIRLVEGVSGAVSMEMDLVARFDYGSTVPWVRRIDGGLALVAGPDALELVTPIALDPDDLASRARFVVRQGERVPFVLTWHPSWEPPPPRLDPATAIDETVDWWQQWSQRCTKQARRSDLVERSLITVKALTYAPTGGIIAAPTTSLPEVLGGVRNWDYRFCWLRDATFALQALLDAGYQQEAVEWRDWLLRAIAGDPSQMQIMYGVAGERRLPEFELPWLSGYEKSAPVRVGNGAATQLQLDVYGEVIDAFFQASAVGIPADTDAWRVQLDMLEWLEGSWQEPDHGLWEVRGLPRDFVHSKVMCWVAFDRAARAVDRFSLDGDANKWRRVREAIHAEVCEKGFDANRQTFTQSYGSLELDASLLLIPVVGFLPPDDGRVVGTVDAVQRELADENGFVERYPTHADVSLDGLPGREGAFLLCSFWLADALALIGRVDEATALFDRLCALTNDVGLLSEEYDPVQRRMLGNFPQAFSHVGLINTAMNVGSGAHPAQQRSAL